MDSSPRPRSGVTLLELTTALALLAVALSVALPPGLAARDRWAVHVAAGEVASVFVRARAEAPARGGVRVEAEESTSSVRLFAGDSLLAGARPLERGVTLEIVGTATRVELTFDALGIGRIASRRIVLTRGRAADTLTVSSYGRVTR